MSTKKQGGFTLIELVVVIALLGILAAFAIPRFASLEREARAATTQSLSGSVRSASAMSHGLFLATGTTPISLEGNSIVITNGYPDADDIADTLADSTGYTVSTNGAGDTTTFVKTGASGTCQVVYVEAAVNGAPAITVDTSGC